LKLLLDVNLSHRLVPLLQAAFPGTSQVADIGLGSADDLTVWRCAGEHGFAPVTNRDDFLDLARASRSAADRHPSGVRDSSNAQVLTALRDGRPAIETAVAQPDIAVIELG
jgi:predicted nuclease of predicted toxin-antitoxin system